MLGDISNTTEGGSYYFVDKDSDVSSAFGDALGGVLSVVAQNTFLHIKPGQEGVSILNVKHDKAERQTDGSFKVALGDFYAEESRDVLLETSLLSTPNGDKGVPHVNITASYLDTINKKLAKSPDHTGTINRPDGMAISMVNNHVALQGIRIATTEVICKAEGFAKNERLEQARTVINEHFEYVQNEANSLEESTNPLIVQILSDLNSILAGLSTRSEYHAVGSKLMQTKQSTHQWQRCYESNSATTSAFRSSKKQQMAVRMKKRSMK